MAAALPSGLWPSTTLPSLSELVLVLVLVLDVDHELVLPTAGVSSITLMDRVEGIRRGRARARGGGRARARGRGRGVWIGGLLGARRGSLGFVQDLGALERGADEWWRRTLRQ